MRKLSFLVEEDNKVLQMFKENEDFEIKVLDNIDSSNVIDILVVGESKIKPEEVSEALHIVRAKEIYYIFNDGSAMTFDFQKFENLEIKVTPVKATPKKIYDFIIEDIYKNIKNKSNIFVFYGSSSKVGTTITSQGVAEMIAENTNLKVLFMCLAGTKGDYYLKVEGSQTIEDITEKLKHRLLSEKRTLSNCTEINRNLKVLLGNENIIKRRDLNPYDIENLLKLVKNNFDVIIIDTGSLIELGSTIGSLMQTKNRYLVVDDSMVGLTDFLEVKKNVLPKIQVNDFKTIVNKFDDDSTYKDEEISKFYGYEHLVTLPILEEGKDCEYNKKTLYSLKNKKYNNNLEKIATDILSQINVKFEISKSDKGIFGKVRKLVGSWV